VIAENYWGGWAVFRRLGEKLMLKKELKGKI
jgi:hypothetical protein